MASSLSKKVPHILCSAFRGSRQFTSRFVSDSYINGQRTLTTSQSLTSESEQSTPAEGALRKFDKLVEKVKSQQTEIGTSNGNGENKQEEPTPSFATMLRNSKLIALGEDPDKRVTGKIIEVMEDDLYIDFGGKFHCVCPRPRSNGELYQRGTDVVVSLKSQEMSSAFLGSDVHITLLEADAILLGLPKTEMILMQGD